MCSTVKVFDVTFTCLALICVNVVFMPWQKAKHTDGNEIKKMKRMPKNLNGNLERMKISIANLWTWLKYEALANFEHTDKYDTYHANVKASSKLNCYEWYISLCALLISRVHTYTQILSSSLEFLLLSFLSLQTCYTLYIYVSCMLDGGCGVLLKSAKV